MLEGIENLQRGNGRARPCAVTVWLDQLDETDRAQAQAALDDRAHAHGVLLEFFNKNGAGITSDQTIGRHRNRKCCQSLVAA